jgi:hypothetical protein
LIKFSLVNINSSPTFSLFTEIALAFNSRRASPLEDKNPAFPANASTIEKEAPNSARLIVA